MGKQQQQKQYSVWQEMQHMRTLEVQVIICNFCTPL